MNEITEGRIVLETIRKEMINNSFFRRSLKWCNTCGRKHDGSGCKMSKEEDGIYRHVTISRITD